MSRHRPRKHHTLPQLYLRAFADGNQVRWRTRTCTDEIRNIDNVAFTNYFYAFGPEREALVEHWLGTYVENEAAPALNRVLSGTWPPAAPDRQALTRFIAFQMLRTPLIRLHMLQIADAVRPLLWSAAVLDRELKDRTLTDAQKRVVLEDARRRVPPELFSDDPLPLLRTMSREADRLLPVFARRGWSLLRADEPCLIAGDNPVVRVFPAGAPAGFTGLAPEDAELHLPLSPTVLLILDSHGRPGLGDVRALTDEVVAITNNAQARSADRGVVRHPEMPWPADVDLGPEPPRLPRPRITTTFGHTGPPTFPATYPPTNDPAVAALLTMLGAEDTVD